MDTSGVLCSVKFRGKLEYCKIFLDNLTMDSFIHDSKFLDLSVYYFRIKLNNLIIVQITIELCVSFIVNSILEADIANISSDNIAFHDKEGSLIRAELLAEVLRSRACKMGFQLNVTLKDDPLIFHDTHTFNAVSIYVIVLGS